MRLQIYSEFKKLHGETVKRRFLKKEKRGKTGTSTLKKYTHRNRHRVELTGQECFS